MSEVPVTESAGIPGEWTLYDAINLLALALYRLRYEGQFGPANAPDVAFSNGTEHEIYQAQAARMLHLAPMLWRAIRDGLRDDDAVLQEYAAQMAAGDRTRMAEMDRAARS